MTEVKRYSVHMVFDYEVETDDMDKLLKEYELPNFSEVASEDTLVGIRVETVEIERD